MASKKILAFPDADTERTKKIPLRSPVMSGDCVRAAILPDLQNSIIIITLL